MYICIYIYTYSCISSLRHFDCDYSWLDKLAVIFPSVPFKSSRLDSPEMCPGCINLGFVVPGRGLNHLIDQVQHIRMSDTYNVDI